MSARSASIAAVISLSFAGCYDWDRFAARDPELQPPRPIAPPSGARLTGARPRLRWALSADTDGAIVEVCEDRECNVPVFQQAVVGDAVDVPTDLPARVLFWRLRATRGDVIGERVSPVWSFAVRRARAGAVEDTAWSGTIVDLNGDGLADVAVPSPGEGVVRVYLSTGDRSLEESAVIDLGAASTDPRGLVVSSAGDVDGDGFVDLAIVARSDCVAPFPHPGPPGRSFVVRGSPLGPILSPEHERTTTVAGACFGHSVAATDFDADGYSDVVVSAVDRGAVYVFEGSSDGLGETPIERRPPPGQAVELGRSVTVGDLDADGYGDAVIEAYTVSPGVITAHVLSGGPSGPEPDVARPYVPASFTFAPRNAAGAIGDVDGDGSTDIAFADDRTIAVLASTLPPDAPALIPSEGGHDLLRAVGDVDGDGFGDVAAGMYARSKVQLVLGGDPATLAPIDVRWIGEDGVEHGFGSAVGGPGDIDGDGFDDFVVGAPEVRGGGNQPNSGRAYVFFGARDGVLSEPVVLIGPDLDNGAFGSGIHY